MKEQSSVSKSTIIGGGPAGSFAGYCLSKAGHEVVLVEEHREIGVPWQCTGILTSNIHPLLHSHGLKLPSSVIHDKVSSVSIVGPNHKSLDLHFKEPDVILDRSGFDQWLYDKFLSAGGTGLLGHRFLSAQAKSGQISLKYKDKTLLHKTKSLIGADGPQSSVAENFSLLSDRRYFSSLQAVVKCNHDSVLRFYPHIGSFAWAVPAGDGLLRVGLCMDYLAGRKGRLQHLFDSFLKNFSGSLISRQGGLIPYFNPYEKVQGRSGVMDAYLVGDAATQVKSTTGGGIIPGMRAGALLSSNIGSNYDTAFGRSRNYFELYSHHIARRAMDKFSNNDWDRLISKMNSPRVKDDLNSVGRDNLLKLGLKIGFHKPSLLGFVKKLF